MQQVPRVQKQYRGLTHSWENKVRFELDVEISDNRVFFEVFTQDELFWLLDESGAEPHFIAARRAPTLRFRENFTPKTSVGSLESFAGGKTGNYVTPFGVTHPGFEARKWSKEISIQLEKSMLQDIETAMSKVIGELES